jgi:NADH-quinone oxidoreductase subunit N
MLLISSNNLLATFLCIEGLSIVLYFFLATDLTGQGKKNVLSYFAIGGVASILFIYGIFRVYLITGTFDYDIIRQFFINLDPSLIEQNSVSYTVTLACVLVGILFKLAAFPSYF